MRDYEDKILFGDALEQLKTVPDETVQMCVTSPPYWGLRDYGHDGQLGLENEPEKYVEKLVNIFAEVKRVLKNDGTLWLNLGDSYCGSGGPGSFVDNKRTDNFKNGTYKNPARDYKGLKPKDLCMIPARVAMALQADGWYLRSDIIWHKNNVMPESVKDRPTNCYEHIFLLSKSRKYYYDWEAIAEPTTTNENRPHGIVRNREYNYDSKLNEIRGQKEKGNVPNNGGQQRHGEDIPTKNIKNKRDVWSVNTKPFSGAHFAVYPPKLIEPCIKAGSKPNDIVLDPFFGSGTTGEVSKRLNRHYLGIELNREYEQIQQKRLAQKTLAM